MKFGNSRIWLSVGILSLMLPIAAQAQWWQHHPRYLRAMSDLRTAYWLIQHHEAVDPAMSDAENRAMRQIRFAYQSLKDAAIMDNKDIDAQPPTDMTWYDHRGRLHHALDLLNDARSDVMGEEDDPAALGLRAEALRRIDAAARATANAIRYWGF